MEALVHEVFAEYATQPWLVYGAICLFMLMSAFGLPIPEEVVLVSAGLIGYVALKNPSIDPNASVVNVYILATVALFAVLGADFLIYSIGKRLGPKLFRTRRFSRMVSEKSLEKIQRWMWDYGSLTVVVFRFTPGVRFPGHLMCGAMGIPAWKFLAIDWIAAGLSVPTQVMLVAFYGEFILQYFTRFKIVVFSGLAIFVAVYFGNKYWKHRKAKAAEKRGLKLESIPGAGKAVNTTLPEATGVSAQVPRRKIN